MASSTLWPFKSKSSVTTTNRGGGGGEQQQKRWFFFRLFCSTFNHSCLVKHQIDIWPFSLIHWVKKNFSNRNLFAWFSFLINKTLYSGSDVRTSNIKLWKLSNWKRIKRKSKLSPGTSLHHRPCFVYFLFAYKMFASYNVVDISYKIHYVCSDPFMMWLHILSS